MGLSLILIGLIIVGFMLYIIMAEWPSLRTLYMANKIHGPRGLPIFGSIFLIRSLTGAGLLDFLQKLQKEYPRLSSIYITGISLIFVHEPEDVQEILGSINHIKKGREYDLISPWLLEGLLTSYGAKWQARRKLLTPTFHFRILEDSLGSMNAKTNLLTKKLTESKGKAIKVEKYVTGCALDIIGESAMGINLEAQSEAGQIYLKKVKETSEAVISRLLSVWAMKNFVYQLSSKGKQFFNNIDILHSFTEKVIGDRKKIHRKTSTVITEDDSGRKVRKAFLDCLLDAQRNDSESITDQDIREEVDTFMFEGHDTTSAAVSFALWLLGTFPEEQEKVYEELKDIFGEDDREVSMPDVHRMVYLEKVIKETLRLFPSVPYITRRLTQDCVLDDGTVIPSHANVAIIPYLLHRNPRFFPDPEKFDPERFSEDNAVGRHPFAYIPFSAGPRNCIGQKFAMTEMKVTLANILRQLEVKSITRRDEFKILPYLIIKPTVPLQVKFSPRARQ